MKKINIYESIKNKAEKIAIVGLGYVGLPLAVEFGKIAKTIGFDLNLKRISDLKRHIDNNNEMAPEEIKSALFLEVSYNPSKAEELGYHPQVILAGRSINDDMGKYIAEQTVKQLIEANKTVKSAKVIIFGITFKENVSDIRNSRVIDIINELKEYGVDVIVCDPLADREAVKDEYGIELTEYNRDILADGIVIAVKHDIFKEKLSMDALKNHLSNNGNKGVIIDVKGLFDSDIFNGSDLSYWRL